MAVNLNELKFDEIQVIEVGKMVAPAGPKGWYRWMVEKIGAGLRDGMFLPGYGKLDPENIIDRALAADIVAQVPRGLGRIFAMRDIAVRVNADMTREFTVRLFESAQIKIYLFSFYGNREFRGHLKDRWEPTNARELAEGPLDVLGAIDHKGETVDSLMTVSLGNVLYEGVKEDTKLPKNLIINRGLASVHKVGEQLFSSPKKQILYGVAWWTGWAADPEARMLDYLSTGRDHRVIQIEALHDFFFSNKGGFAADFHEKLKVPVWRGSFYVFRQHIRAHHAAGLDQLEHNRATQIKENTFDGVHMRPGENVAEFLARAIFADKKPHTLFIVGGNDMTLDVGTVREVIPLMEAIHSSPKVKA